MIGKTQRQRIYELIEEKGPMTVRAASTVLGIKPGSVSSLVSVLVDDGLIKIVGTTRGLGKSTAFIYAGDNAKVRGICCGKGNGLTPTEIRVHKMLSKKGPMIIRDLMLEMRISYQALSGYINRMGKKDAVKVIGVGDRGAYIYSASRLPISKDCGCVSFRTKARNPLPHDELKDVMVANISNLGGGPFRVMAAQLGARA